MRRNPEEYPFSDLARVTIPIEMKGGVRSCTSYRKFRVSKSKGFCVRAIPKTVKFVFFIHILPFLILLSFIFQGKMILSVVWYPFLDRFLYILLGFISPILFLQNSLLSGNSESYLNVLIFSMALQSPQNLLIFDQIGFCFAMN